MRRNDAFERPEAKGIREISKNCERRNRLHEGYLQLRSVKSWAKFGAPGAPRTSSAVVGSVNIWPLPVSAKGLSLARLLILTLFVGIGGLRASERWATLEAIHQIENPRNSTRPGPFGELGAYQFRSTTWRMHTAIPFERAHDRQISDAIAVTHYEYLKRGLRAAGLAPSTYNIALAWNSGLSAAINGTSPRVSHQYATRATNLASTFVASAAAKVQTPVVAAPAPKPVEPIVKPDVIYFAGLTPVEPGPTVTFQWFGSSTPVARVPDFTAAFHSEMRVSLTE
jgi:hypothetical protein